MDLADYLRFALALLFVLGLIGLLAWLVRRYRPGDGLRADGRRRRLALLETLPLDARRRLVLVRRDDVLHLLLLGEDGNRLIESFGAGDPRPADETSAPAGGGAR